MNKVYLYDGEFSSLLVLIMSLIQIKPKDVFIKSECDFKPNLLDNPIYLNIEKRLEKLKYINKNVSREVMHILYYIYLSNDENKENVMYYFLLNAFKYGKGVLYHGDLNCVNKALKISKYVGNETHKLKGFLRFKKMKNNFYYAEVEPVNNVILLLAHHFKTRMPNEYFLIKDVKRKIYVMYDLKKLTILYEEDIKKLNIDVSNDEIYIEELWKEFFYTIAIKERENKKCQMNFMPKRYWSHMIEMEERL